MAIGINLLTNGSDVTDALIYTTAAITSSANGLNLIAIENRQTTQDEPTTVVSGGLSWTKVASVIIVGSNRRLTVWRFLGQALASTTVVITYLATQTHCQWAILEFTGVDTSGTNGSGAVVQSPTNTNNAASHTVITNSLSAFGSSNNMCYAVFVVNNGVTGTPASGYTEDYDFQETEDVSTMEIAHKLNDTSPSCTWSLTCSASLAIAIEVKAGASVSFVPVQRKTLSPIGTRIGSRQIRV